MRLLACLLIGLLILPASGWAQDSSSASSIYNPGRSGLPSDGRPTGTGVTDLGNPTENVKALTAAGFGRQDDLRNLMLQLVEAKQETEKALREGEIKRISESVIAEGKIRAALFDGQEKANVVAFSAQEKAQGLALASIKEITAASFASQEKAVTKQENAFKDFLAQQKTELDVRFRSTDDKVAAAVTQLNLIAGRSEGGAVVWYVVSIAIGFLIGIGALYVSGSRQQNLRPTNNMMTHLLSELIAYNRRLEPDRRPPV